MAKLPNIAAKDRAGAMASAQMYLLRVLYGTMLERGVFDTARIREIANAAPDGDIRAMVDLILKPLMDGGDILGKPN